MRAGLSDLQVLEVPAEEASVAGQESISLDLRMSADQEIRDNAKPRSLLVRMMPAPRCARQPGGLARERRKREAEIAHGVLKLRLILEVSTDLCPDDIARDQCSAVKGSAKRFTRRWPEHRLGPQHVEKDRRIDRGLHDRRGRGPRISSSSRSTGRASFSRP